MHSVASARWINGRIPVPYRNRCKTFRIMGDSFQAALQISVQAQTVRLTATDLTPESFKPFGQVIGPTEDGKEFDSQDAQLILDRGTPSLMALGLMQLLQLDLPTTSLGQKAFFPKKQKQFYIMRIPERGRRFNRITYHANVTQCLGGLNPALQWFLAVAKPSSSVQQYPKPEDIMAFKIQHGVFVKLEPGTWHAGPLFEGTPFMDFYNLELKDTNVVDHNTHDYTTADFLEFEVVDE